MSKLIGVSAAAIQVTLCRPNLSACFVKKKDPIEKQMKLIEPKSPISYGLAQTRSSLVIKLSRVLGESQSKV